MNISLESIDKLRARTNLTYKEAKEILEKTNGDVLEALIYLEENEESFSDRINEKTDKVLNKVKEIIKSGNVTKIVLKKDNQILMNIPLTAGAIGAVFAPTLAAIGIGTAFLTNCTIEISKKDGEIININNYAENAMDKAKDIKNKTVSKVKTIANEVKEKAEEAKEEVIKETNEIIEDTKNSINEIKDDLDNVKR